MNLFKLTKTTQKRKKRIGRGYGSGRGGHTSTRGAKGTKARSKVGLFFQGTKTKKSLLKRLPLLRGKGRLKPKTETIILPLEALNAFKKGEEVNFATLQEKGILPSGLPARTPVKILSDGEIKAPLTVNLPVSEGARKKIEKAGGQVVVTSEGK